MQIRKQRLSISFLPVKYTYLSEEVVDESNPNRLSPETLLLNSEEASFCIVLIWLIEF